MKNLTLEKIVIQMIYASMMVLALGLVTSISILAFYHILMALPMIVFLTRTDYKRWSVSTWSLVVMSFFIVLSILCNQDIAVNGYKSLSKIKYFIYGFLTIAPMNFYFKKYSNDKKIKLLLYLFLISTTFATIVGIISKYQAYNFITLRSVDTQRSAGLYGMVMNYAHNMAYFQIIITGLVIYKKEVQKFINLNFLYIVFIINLIGLYFTYTRGAWLAFLLGLPIFLFKKNKKWFLGVILLITIIGIMAYSVAGKSVIRPKSDEQRLSQWSAAFMAFKEKPIMGYGYLNFEHYSQEIKKRYDLNEKNFGGHAHSNFFEMLGSVGILGFISFVVWLITWIIEMYKRNDLIAKLSLPFIIVFIGGGLTQSTISLGVNLFFVMAAYSFSQINTKDNCSSLDEHI